jgi:transcriptional regulator with XRE-family HTH domain
VTASRAATLPSEKQGEDRAYVSGLELGQRNPAIVALCRIAKALGMKLRLFFDDEQPARRRQAR